MGYVGGKGGAGVYQRIICQVPPHATYIEPFLGGGAVLRMMRPAARSYGVDLDPRALAAYGDAAGVVPAAWSPPAGIAIPAGKGLHLLRADALTFLRHFPWTGREFVYCDPPYLFESRTQGERRYYQEEMGRRDSHIDLMTLLLGLKCNVAISAYPHELYRIVLGMADRPWRCLTFLAMARSGELREEHLWMNYPEPVALHDYRYLGDNFRERERIKRKTARWRAKLEGMPLLERRALLAALDALDHR